MPIQPKKYIFGSRVGRNTTNGLLNLDLQLHIIMTTTNIRHDVAQAVTLTLAKK